MQLINFLPQAQMMAKEYKSWGGGYKTDKKDRDESQKHLSKWTEEEWQTKEGSGHAKQDDGTQKRYVPKKAWEEMTKKEKEETEAQKQQGSKNGKQFVPNTSRARSARKKANEEEDEAYEKKKEQGKEEEGRQTRSKTKNQEGQSQPQKSTGGNKAPTSDETAPASKKAGQKRSRGKEIEENAKQESSIKKQKASSGISNKKSDGTVGSKHDKAEPPAQQGSKSRLPKKGQTVHWKALPCWVEGSVVEVAKSSKEVDGKQVKAGKDDPGIVLKSKSRGKIATRKPNSVYFD